VDITALIGSYQGPMVAFRVEAADVGIAVARLPSPEAIEQGDPESTERSVHHDGDVFVTAVPGDGGDHPTITFVGGGRFLHNGRAHPPVGQPLPEGFNNLGGLSAIGRRCRRPRPRMNRLTCDYSIRRGLA
jgi:hypothetical protein